MKDLEREPGDRALRLLDVFASVEADALQITAAFEVLRTSLSAAQEIYE